MPPNTPIDLSKIKPGDEVTVRGVVTEMNGECHSLYYGGENYICVRVSPLVGRGKAWAPEKSIISHTPKALAVGDRVRFPYGVAQRLTGVIRAAYGPAFLIERDGVGFFHAALAENVERAL